MQEAVRAKQLLAHCALVTALCGRGSGGHGLDGSWRGAETLGFQTHHVSIQGKFLGQYLLRAECSVPQSHSDLKAKLDGLELKLL